MMMKRSLLSFLPFAALALCSHPAPRVSAGTLDAAVLAPAPASREKPLTDAWVLASVDPRTPSVPTKRPTAQGMARGMTPPEELRLNLEGRDVVTILATGEVRLADGLNVDEASAAFWKKVAELAPSFCHARRTEK
jgi:hypothetical protein